MTYNVVLVLGIQQSESATCTHIYPFFFRFFPHIGYHRVLNRFPWAISRSLLLTVLYIVLGIYQSQPPNPSLPAPTISPLVTISLILKFFNLFLFCEYILKHHFYEIPHVSDCIWYLSLFYVLHLVWWSLGPSMLLQMI